MAREIKDDFDRLCLHINEYSLSQLLENEELLLCLKQQHKKYLALLFWIAEIRNREALFISNIPGIDVNIVERLTESISDMGSAFFNWMHGNYKAARVMIRVSIENFIRSISSIWLPDQKTETNTFTLMSEARSLGVLSTVNCKPLVDSLHSDYRSLCADAHTSSARNMYSISTLADFPITDQTRGRAACDIFSRVGTNFTIILGILFNTFFHGFHHMNKEVVLAVIPRSMKVLLASEDGV